MDPPSGKRVILRIGENPYHLVRMTFASIRLLDTSLMRTAFSSRYVSSRPPMMAVESALVT